MPQCIESLPTGTAHTDREHSRTKTNAPSGSTAAETHLKTTAASRKHTGTPSSRSLIPPHACSPLYTYMCVHKNAHIHTQADGGRRSLDDSQGLSVFLPRVPIISKNKPSVPGSEPIGIEDMAHLPMG
ncbi:unnamed protein product [Arctogadus glacialis]